MFYDLAKKASQELRFMAGEFEEISGRIDNLSEDTSDKCNEAMASGLSTDQLISDAETKFSAMIQEMSELIELKCQEIEDASDY